MLKEDKQIFWEEIKELIIVRTILWWTVKSNQNRIVLKLEYDDLKERDEDLTVENSILHTEEFSE